jgi:hypothetical protein
VTVLKSIKRALVVACIMSILSGLGEIWVIVSDKINLDKATLLSTQVKLDDTPHLIDIMSEDFHRSLCWHLAGFAWYAVMAALIIFAIRQLKTSD